MDKKTPLHRPPRETALVVMIFGTVLLGLNHADGGLVRLVLGAIATLALLVGIFAAPVSGFSGFMTLDGDQRFRRVRNGQLLVGTAVAYLASFFLDTALCVMAGILAAALWGQAGQDSDGAGRIEE
ncbi:hypothetical protein [Luteococcus peritonei]|uniref:DUF4190 domain-containing protein n=1 Tax=Luteococcus peritonei TaxID=88874 RepID=A0ABW4RQY3_9ACTN